MHITESARQGIYKYMGSKTDAFLAQAAERVEKYTREWRLSRLDFMETNTVNLLFSCVSALYGPCVLKVCIPGPEVATEIHCLQAYGGKGYCRLWAYDLADDILLLEKVIPGSQLWAEEDYRRRATLFAQLLKALPQIDSEPGQYPTYLHWLEKTRAALISMGGMEDMLFYLDKAMEVYAELRLRHSRAFLLHGDLHQENLLLNAGGGYTVIDPKGVIDAPVMETARFLLNETPCAAEKIQEITAILAQILGTPQKDILKAMFVDAALSNSWTMEEHFATTQAFEDAKQAALEFCGFVYSLLG